MIGFLRGRIAAKHPPLLVMDVAGVGYEIEAPMSTFYGLPAVGTETTLHTHLVVREDAHVLFGFGTERERSLFRELIKVSNVGPRIALAILSGVSVEDFHRCVEAEDVASLVRIPGIGRKTAERILEQRQKSGGFKKIEELMNIKGIGEKSFLKIKPMVFVAPKSDKAGGGTQDELMREPCA